MYRKMLAEGVFFLVLQLTLAISTLVLYFHAQTPVDNAALITTMTYVSNICQYLSFALCLLSGLFANRLYYAHVRRVIQKTKQQFVGAAQEYTSELVRRGSVSPLATGIGFLASSFLSVMAMYMVIYLMY